VVNKTTLELTIPNISVSVCDFVEQRRREEIINLTLKGIHMIMVTTKEDLELEVTLNRIQVDHNSVVCEYPVVLGNYEHSNDSQIKVNDILTVKLKMLQDTVTTHVCFDYLLVSLHGLRADVEEEFLTKVQKAIKKVQDAQAYLNTEIDNMSLI
jgi:hypothetical protein